MHLKTKFYVITFFVIMAVGLAACGGAAPDESADGGDAGEEAPAGDSGADAPVVELPTLIGSDEESDAASVEAPTPTAQPAPTEAPVEAVEPPPTIEAPTEAPTARPIIIATPSSLPQILNFTAAVEDLDGGRKRITFNWESVNGNSAYILSGTSMRFSPRWDVATSGTLTIELDNTLHRNPPMTLYVVDENENQAYNTIIIEWACPYPLFYSSTPPDDCIGPAQTTAAAEQTFQTGRMLWLQDPGNAIFVLYNDGTWQRFANTWQSSEVESNPGTVPPDGLYQPTRGFGKVWRENIPVWESLGWAVAPEQSYTATWQQQGGESVTTTALYLSTAGGQVLALYGAGSDGTWGTIVP